MQQGFIVSNVLDSNYSARALRSRAEINRGFASIEGGQILSRVRNVRGQRMRGDVPRPFPSLITVLDKWQIPLTERRSLRPNARPLTKKRGAINNSSRISARINATSTTTNRLNYRLRRCWRAVTRKTSSILGHFVSSIA